MTSSWVGHSRPPLPRNWSTIRNKVKTRAGGTCQCTGCTLHQGPCTTVGTDCDHIGDRDNHSLNNLQWLCHQCHQVKTAGQAREAIRLQRQKLTHPSTRTKHPGLL